MSRIQTIVAVAVFLVISNLSGCTMIAGDCPESKRPATLGVELRDLKVARDTGAVSDDEYNAAKAKLLASYDKH